jgi:hypothetical protein
MMARDQKPTRGAAPLLGPFVCRLACLGGAASCSSSAPLLLWPLVPATHSEAPNGLGPPGAWWTAGQRASGTNALFTLQ